VRLLHREPFVVADVVRSGRSNTRRRLPCAFGAQSDTMDHELILLCSFAVTVGEGRRTRLLLEIAGKVEVRASNAPVREMQRASEHEDKDLQTLPHQDHHQVKQ